ncbi:MAG: DUF2834 domain-containing protein [Bdellovibrionaceae bacterium]|nr:DUF2834 domain-containing protein [Pseudobdellovibrionaceae bacterium]
MRNIWLVLAVLGVAIPFSHFAPFLMEQGLNLPLFWDLLFANRVSSFFATDLIISSIAFLLWSYFDSKKNKVTHWWLILAANLLLGLSLALPLYFFRRHSALK